MTSAEGYPTGIKLIDAYVAHYITAATEGIGSKALSRIVGNIALEPISVRFLSVQPVRATTKHRTMMQR